MNYVPNVHEFFFSAFINVKPIKRTAGTQCKMDHNNSYQNGISFRNGLQTSAGM